MEIFVISSILRGDVYVRDPKTLRPTTEPFMYKGNQVHFTEDITLAKKDNTIEVGNDAQCLSAGLSLHQVVYYSR